MAAASAGRNVASTIRRAGSGRRATCASQSSVEASLQWISSSLSSSGACRRDRLDRQRQFAQHALARGAAARLQRAALRSGPQRRHLREPARRMGRENVFDIERRRRRWRAASSASIRGRYGSPTP